MPDVRELLQRKLEDAIVPDVTFEGFLRRRERSIRRQRLTAGVVAIVVAVAALGVILRSIDRSAGVPAATPTMSPQIVALEPQGSIAFNKLGRTGDSIYLECHWNNPDATDVYWGEGTGDEMCLSTYFVSQ